MEFKSFIALIYHFVGLSAVEDKSKDGMSYSKNSGEGVELCCVCLWKFKEGEDMRVLPCRHRFHKVCVDRWFSACRRTCPVCRFSMAEEEEEENVQKSEEEFTEEMVIWFSSFHIAGF
ncbi:E3 ubiquitin-protein ligase RNF167-like [Tripterygium wilfordii]|nr:E3 ubiquitin-protein ligase RNF167-like [Tripterygium wilfordii]